MFVTFKTLHNQGKLDIYVLVQLVQFNFGFYQKEYQGKGYLG